MRFVKGCYKEGFYLRWSYRKGPSNLAASSTTFERLLFFPILPFVMSTSQHRTRRLGRSSFEQVSSCFLLLWRDSLLPVIFYNTLPFLKLGCYRRVVERVNLKNKWNCGTVLLHHRICSEIRRNMFVGNSVNIFTY